jgi:3',5'-cyclic AMP phosphodiesterase CpdA
MRLAWLTDLHLNFVKDEYRTALLVQAIESAGADAILVGGDIGEADSFAEYLEVLNVGVALPTYFVQGAGIGCSRIWNSGPRFAAGC